MYIPGFLLREIGRASLRGQAVSATRTFSREWPAEFSQVLPQHPGIYNMKSKFLSVVFRSITTRRLRLKLIKRSMYGRAEFDLLKLRVLYQSKNIQERKNKYKSSQAQPADHLKKRRRMKNGTNPRGIIAGISKGA